MIKSLAINYKLIYNKTNQSIGGFIMNWTETENLLPYRLKETRKKLKRTQKQIANAVGISTQAYQKYESTSVEKHNDPSLDTIIKLAKELNVSVDWLLGLECPYSVPAVEAMMIVLDSFSPYIKLGDGKESPYLMLTFNENNKDNNGNELKGFVEQYLFMKKVESEGQQSETDTTDIVNAIRNHLLDRYRYLPILPGYDFVIEHEKKETTAKPKD